MESKSFLLNALLMWYLRCFGACIYEIYCIKFAHFTWSEELIGIDNMFSIFLLTAFSSARVFPIAAVLGGCVYCFF